MTHASKSLRRFLFFKALYSLRGCLHNKQPLFTRPGPCRSMKISGGIVPTEDGGPPPGKGASLCPMVSKIQGAWNELKDHLGSGSGDLLSHVWSMECDGLKFCSPWTAHRSTWACHLHCADFSRVGSWV